MWHCAVLSSRCADDVTREQRHDGLYVTIASLIITYYTHTTAWRRRRVCYIKSSKLTFFLASITCLPYCAFCLPKLSIFTCNFVITYLMCNIFPSCVCLSCLRCTLIDRGGIRKENGEILTHGNSTCSSALISSTLCQIKHNVFCD